MDDEPPANPGVFINEETNTKKSFCCLINSCKSRPGTPGCDTLLCQSALTTICVCVCVCVRVCECACARIGVCCYTTCVPCLVGLIACVKFISLLWIVVGDVTR